eukprot:11159886-Lingulodinium_polyedra.AAC.1
MARQAPAATPPPPAIGGHSWGERGPDAGNAVMPRRPPPPAARARVPRAPSIPARAVAVVSRAPL